MNQQIIKEAMKQYTRTGTLDIRKAKAAIESSRPYGLYGRYEPGNKYIIYLNDKNNNEHKIFEYDTREQFSEAYFKQKIEKFNATHRAVLCYSKLFPDEKHLNTLRTAFLH